MSSQSEIEEHCSWTSLEWDLSETISSISQPSGDIISTVNCIFFERIPYTEIDLSTYSDDTISRLLERLSNKIRIPIEKFELYRKNQCLNNKLKNFPNFINNEKLFIVQSTYNDRKLYQQQIEDELMNKIKEFYNENDSIKTNKEIYLNTFNLNENNLLNIQNITSIQWRTCLNERNQMENKQDDLLFYKDFIEENKKKTLKLFVEYSKGNIEEWQYASYIDGIYFSSIDLKYEDSDILSSANLTGRIYSPYIIGNSIDFLVNYNTTNSFRIEYHLNTIRTRHQTSFIFKSKTDRQKKLFLNLEKNIRGMINKIELDQIRSHLFSQENPNKIFLLSDYEFFQIFLSSIGIETIHRNNQNCFWQIYELAKEKFSESNIIKMRNQPLQSSTIIKMKSNNCDNNIDKENIC